MRTPLFLLSVAFLAACATAPTGPTVAVMPGSHKTLTAFSEDAVICKDYAAREVQGGDQSANTRQVLTTGVTTLLGTGLGAAISGGRGAAVGASAGLLGGTAIGGLGAAHASDTLQDRYNIAYGGCMFTKHNQVPAIVAGAGR